MPSSIQVRQRFWPDTFSAISICILLVFNSSTFVEHNTTV